MVNVLALDSTTCKLFQYTDSFGLPGTWVKNVGDAALNNGAVCMKGYGHLEIPFYKAMDWNKKLSITFEFQVIV
jgi:hypothetical protein